LLKKLLNDHHFRALYGYLGITLIFTYPLVLKFFTHIPGQGDNLIFYWGLWWVKKALFELKTSPLFCDYIFYPSGASLMLHSHAIINGLISVPFQFFFNLPACYNIIVLLSFVFSGYGAYLLSDYLVKNKSAAFISGVIFAFCPYKFAHLMGHMSLVAAEFIPFYVLFLIKALRDEKPLKNMILSAVFLSLAAWNDYYYFIFLVLFTFFYLFYLLLTEKKEILGPLFIKKAPVFLIFCCVGIMPLVVLSINEILHGYYISSGPGLYSVFVSDLAAFFTPSGFSPFFGNTVSGIYYSIFSGGIAESNVFIGYTVILLSCYIFARYFNQLKQSRFWFYCALCFFLLSLGPSLHLFGRDHERIVLPAKLLQYLPIFNAIRSSGRFAIMGMLSLSVFFAYGCVQINQKLKNKAVFPFVVLALILLEYLPAPYPLMKTPVPEIYKNIAQEKGDFTVLEIPLGWDISSVPAGKPSLHFQLWQTVHNKRLLNGIISRGSTSLPDSYFEIPMLSTLFRLQEGIDKEALLRPVKKDIELLNIRYIVVHSPYDKPGIMNYIKKAVPGSSVTEYKNDGITVFKLPEKGYAFQCNNAAKQAFNNLLKYSRGWYYPEFWGDRFFHWSKGTVSELSFEIDKPSSHIISMDLLPFPADSKGQAISIYVNDKFLALLELKPGWHNYALNVPAGYLKIGKNITRFTYKSVSMPKSVLPGSADTRELAAGLSNFRIDEK